MNSVQLIGRLTRDPEVRYTGNQLPIARFSIAIDRGKDKDGNDRGADFPNIVVFGRAAENCGKYLAKGRMVAVSGRLQTGSYEKDGRKVYTTDVIADRVDFIDWGDRQGQQGGYSAPAQQSGGFAAQDQQPPIPQGMEEMDDELPF